MKGKARMSAEKARDEAQVAARIEHAKALIDYAKHLTTLSTGSIVLLAAFVEKVFPTPIWKALTAVSIVGFVVSILGAMVLYTMVIPRFSLRVPTRWEIVVGIISMVLAWGGFLSGILSLATFTIKNLLQ